MHLIDKILHAKSAGQKLFAMLIDPEKCDAAQLETIVAAVNTTPPDLILVGGSQLQCSVEATIDFLKKWCKIPVVLFPGNAFQLTANADAMLLLSLFSGRNAEWLVGQQVRAARAIFDSKIETIPTGYLLIDGSKQTAVQRVSQTKPLATDDIETIVATALAAEQSGKKMIYLEAGSGAKRAISTEIIEKVRQFVNVPLIVGGGITTPEQMNADFAAGADIVVVGNWLETHLEELKNFVAINR